ncbi:MAG: hypothetical protein P4L86_02955 [Mycobacterium sp.]|nr:hypothetical protein [Mycobacterium sp.]
MTADPTDTHRSARLDTAPCRLRGGYHIPHLPALDPGTKASTRGPGSTLALMPVGERSADMLQARLFIELLEAELADMRTQLATTKRGGKMANPGAETRREEVHARADEVARLLDALAVRFPNA